LKNFGKPLSPYVISALAYHDNKAQRPLLKPEAIWEVENAAKISGQDVYEASTTRTAWYACLMNLFERFDFLALPSAQVFPFAVEIPWPQSINGKAMDSYHRWMQVVTPCTLSGCPIMNVPVGFAPQGRAMGMQIIGRPQQDLSVLQLAHAYEKALEPFKDPVVTSSQTRHIRN
jgi:amidase